jgi:hypothetical protein
MFATEKKSEMNENRIRDALVQTFGEARGAELLRELSTMPMGFRMQVIMEETQKLPANERMAAFQRMRALKDAQQSGAQGEQQQQKYGQGLAFLQRLAEQQEQRQGQNQGRAFLQTLASNSQQQQGQGSAFLQRLAPASTASENAVQAEQSSESGAAVEPFLSVEQKQKFMRDGYLVLRDVVPKELTRRARRVINASLGRGVDRSRVADFSLLRGGKGWCPEAAKSKAAMALFHDSNAKRAVDELVGDYWPVGSPQLALRFPGECALKTATVPGLTDLRSLSSDVASSSSQSAAPSLLANIADRVLDRVAGQGTDDKYFVPPNWQRSWHIDGVKEAQAGFVLQFSLLVGVMMSDCEDELSGNLLVYPGGHLALQRYAMERGDPSAVLMRDNVNRPPDIEWPCAPKQIKAREGDVVLAHWLTPHAVSPNLSPDIRYCSYFRVASTDQMPGVFRPDAVENPWKDFRGLASID